MDILWREGLPMERKHRQERISEGEKTSRRGGVESGSSPNNEGQIPSIK